MNRYSEEGKQIWLKIKYISSTRLIHSAVDKIFRIKMDIQNERSVQWYTWIELT